MISNKLKKLLSNNLLLYTTTFISFLNILGFIRMGKLNIVLLFITLALLISVYTKNMIIILGLPLIISNFVSLIDTNREGLEGASDDEKSNIDDNELDNNQYENQDQNVNENEIEVIDEYENDENDEKLNINNENNNEMIDSEINANITELNDKINQLENIISTEN